MKKLYLSFGLFLVIYSMACVSVKDNTMEKEIHHQLTVIDSLLKSTDFSLAIAKTQDTAYYTGIGQPVPPFLNAAEDTGFILKTVKDEKIATNLAGFYALECCIGLLCNRTHDKPTTWLQKVATGNVDTTAGLLLNRFANATWKAGQPFRGMDRISRPVFTVAGFLPANEVSKDQQQVKTAAVKLLSSLQDIQDSSMDLQFKQIRTLLHSKTFALEIAAFTPSSYDTGQQQAQSFADSREDTATVLKSVREQKIATNLAGFYAVECGVSYMVTIKNILPSDVLKSVTDGTISKEDKDLFSRFANATWKAGQPFRGLDRIERETFTPFYFLSKADIDKDWIQIKSAAAVLRTAL